MVDQNAAKTENQSILKKRITKITSNSILDFFTNAFTDQSVKLQMYEWWEKTLNEIFGSVISEEIPNLRNCLGGTMPYLFYMELPARGCEPKERDPGPNTRTLKKIDDCGLADLKWPLYDLIYNYAENNERKDNYDCKWGFNVKEMYE